MGATACAPHVGNFQLLGSAPRVPPLLSTSYTPAPPSSALRPHGSNGGARVSYQIVEGIAIRTSERILSGNLVCLCPLTCAEGASLPCLVRYSPATSASQLPAMTVQSGRRKRSQRGDQFGCAFYVGGE